jgi:hypothetical protein
MSLRECLEHVAFSVRDDTTESISKIKDYIIQTSDDDESFFLLDEIIQDIVETNPHTKQVNKKSILIVLVQIRIRIHGKVDVGRTTL